MNSTLPALHVVEKKIGSTEMNVFFQNTEHFLKQKFQLTNHHDASQVPEAPTIIKKLAYYFLSTTGLIKHALGSYLFGLNLFKIFRDLSEVILNLLTLSYTLLDSFLFLAFEINLLQKNLFPIQENTNLLCKQSQQISLIYTQMANIEVLNCLKCDEFTQLHGLSDYYLQHLTNEHQRLQQKLNSPGTKIFSYFLISIGATSKLSSNYFFCQTFLKTFFPELMGTVPGFIFTATIVLGGLGLYFSVNGAGIYQYIHSETKILKQLDAEIPKLLEQSSYHNQHYPKTLNLFTSLHTNAQQAHLTPGKLP